MDMEGVSVNNHGGAITFLLIATMIVTIRGDLGPRVYDNQYRPNPSGRPGPQTQGNQHHPHAVGRSDNYPTNQELGPGFQDNYYSQGPSWIFKYGDFPQQGIRGQGEGPEG